MNGFQFGVVLVVLAVAVVAVVGAGDSGSGTPSTAATQATDFHATLQDQSYQTNATNQSNATFEPARVSDATVSIAGVELGIETGLLTLRNGTLTLFAKRANASVDGADATATNVRVAFGDRVTPAQAERVRRQIARGETIDSLPEGASYARVSLGLLTVRGPGGAVVFHDTDVNRSVGQLTRPPGNDTAGPSERPFSVSNLSAPSSVPVGQSFNVSARVTNPGNESGTEEVQYRFGGVVVSREVVTLDAGASRTLTFQVSPGTIADRPGTYDHGIYTFDGNQTARIRLTGGDQSASGNGTSGSIAP